MLFFCKGRVAGVFTWVQGPSGSLSHNKTSIPVKLFPGIGALSMVLTGFTAAQCAAWRGRLTL